MYYFIDLDDTLVSTTLLNNDAYNYALEKYGYRRINTTQRITRRNLKIKPSELSKIIYEKQNYFCLPWLKYRVVVNQKLLNLLKNNPKDNCYIWTKADRKRAYAVIKQCRLSKYFNGIIIDDKKNLSYSLNILKSIANNADFMIYENDSNLFRSLSSQITDVIKDDFFDVNGYYLSSNYIKPKSPSSIRL